MTPKEEAAYLQGTEACARRIVQALLVDLNGDTGAQLAVKHSQAKAALYQLYEYLGLGREWSEDLDVADLIGQLEKLLPEGDADA